MQRLLPLGVPRTGGCWPLPGWGHPVRSLHGALCPSGGSRPGTVHPMAPLLCARTPRLLQPALRPWPPACSLSATGGGPAQGQAPGGAPDPVGGEHELSKTQRLKRVFKEYGGVGVSFHIGMSLVSLGIFYMLVSSGVDISAVLLKVGFSDSLVQSKIATGTSTFVLAYAVHKLFAPVRITITLTCVPILVRYFRRIGFFKPPAQRL